ncbi:MAG: cytochrome C peroxidase [Acidobacteria bacterium]|nr:cytochrome C peroxidase [Acidobacteriota bacterium]
MNCQTLIRPAAWLAVVVLTGATAAAQGRGGGPAPGNVAPLRTALVPKPTNLAKYVRNEAALVALGKALFWDSQVGSDGQTACATCHFHAGADHRIQNQLANPPGTVTALSGNRTLTSGDFPFRQLSNPNNNNSAVLRDNRVVAGSAGVVHRTFFDVVPGAHTDDGATISSAAPTSLAGLELRQATNRNSPSVINAVLNVRNFWDGRASRIFSGNTPFGDSDTGLNVLIASANGLQPERVRMDNASLASQAVGPALNATEMSYNGRNWPKLGKKMLALTPLGRQKVATDDSVLGEMANPDGNGLRGEYSYQQLIQDAFQPEYWGGGQIVDASGSILKAAAAASNSNEFRQIEYNFALFFGLAIQAYESTLISDQTRLDQFLEGNTQALTALEQQGLAEFRGGGSQCTRCHVGPELTAASFTRAAANNVNPGDPNDLGFFRIGVSPITEDVGLGGTDGFNIPLLNPNRPGAADGTFKTPGLRNVELTGPYFHNGGQATLEQVVDFYSRQGDFGGANLGPGIGAIRLNAAERTQVVAFLKALTDDRVKFERAPFDHPALCIPVGHAETAPGVPATDDSSAVTALSALDRWAAIPASGKGGNPVPLQTFDELLRGIGNDGSRTHTLTESCQP